MLDKLLKKEGFSITSLQNPLDAIEKLKYDQYDLIITDIQMPNVNGVDFIKHIKSNETYVSIPIMIISTIPQKEINDKLTDLNINAYINKMTFEKNDFVSKIRAILKQNDKK